MTSLRPGTRFYGQLALLLILLAGFGIRIYALERQSMWTDEGLSLYRARLSTTENLANTITIDGVVTRDTNPPLYFLLLSAWRQLAGENITALRALGAIAGWLAIPLMFLLGALIYDDKVGLVAALLMAISPLQAWQSQVLRNYGLLLTWNLFSVYGLVRFALSTRPAGSWRWLGLWLVAGLLGIYTHYFGFFVFAFGIAVLALLLLRRFEPQRLLRQPRTLAALAVLALLFVPAVVVAVDRFRQGQQFDFFPVPLRTVLLHAASAFGVGVNPSLYFPWKMLLPALLLFFAGLWIGLRWRRQGTLILAAYQVIPLGLLFLLSLVNPLYNGVRHLLIGLPPFLLLVAVGLAGRTPAGAVQPFPRWRPLWQAARLVLGLLLIIIQLNWLHTQFTSPLLLRDDVREAAYFLNDVAKEEDIVILHDTIIGFVFDYYYNGAAPRQAIPTLAEQDGEAATARLQEAADTADRVWFLTRPTPRTGFPTDVLSGWAEEHWLPLFEKEYPSMWLRVRLDGYDDNPLVAGLPPSAAPLAATFGDALRLHGLELPGSTRAGAPWWITWYWSRAAASQPFYELSLRFFDENGRLWHQTENLMWEEFPVDQWPESTVVRFDQQSVIPPGLPPGSYAVDLRLLSDGALVTATDGAQSMPLGTITVTQPSTDAAAISGFTAQKAALGPLTLLGYRLADAPVKPGHEIPVELLWQVRGNSDAELQLRLRLLDEQGRTAAEQIEAPIYAAYPATSWQRGAVLRAQSSLTVPAAVEGGTYTLEIALTGADGRVRGRAVRLDQPLEIAPWPFVSDIPAVDVPVGATFGDPPFATLVGYTISSAVPAAGESVDIELVWQVTGTTSDALSAFLHLTDEAGRIVAQQDGAPVNGTRPTSSWRVGEVISDQRALFIGPEVLPGIYDLWVGFYDPASGVRPPADLDGPVADGRVPLGRLTISGSP